MSFLTRKIAKNIRMMKLYGIEPTLGAHLEGFAYRVFGKKSKIDKGRHQRVEIQLLNTVKRVLSIDEYERESSPLRNDAPIWVMWWQGQENYSEVVLAAINSINIHAGNHKVIEVSKDNIEQYIWLPQDIVDMFMNGIISITHFSDIIRFAFLEKYGGIWVNSIIFLIQSFLDSIYSFLIFTIKRPEANNSYIANAQWTTCFIGCGENNPFP